MILVTLYLGGGAKWKARRRRQCPSVVYFRSTALSATRLTYVNRCEGVMTMLSGMSIWIGLAPCTAEVMPVIMQWAVGLSI